MSYKSKKSVRYSVTIEKAEIIKLLLDHAILPKDIKIEDLHISWPFRGEGLLIYWDGEVDES